MEFKLLIACYGLLFIINFLLFGMQRTALLIDREFEGSYVMAVLPKWLAFARLFLLGKITILAILLYIGQWPYALALIVADFILGAALPIPHKLYRETLRSRAEILLKAKGLSKPLEAITNSKIFH